MFATAFEAVLTWFRCVFVALHGVLACGVEVVLGPRLLAIDGAWRNDRPQPFVDSGWITDPYGEAAAAEATEAAWPVEGT